MNAGIMMMLKSLGFDPEATFKAVVDIQQAAVRTVQLAEVTAATISRVEQNQHAIMKAMGIVPVANGVNENGEERHGQHGTFSRIEFDGRADGDDVR